MVFKSHTLVEQIASALKDEILSGRLKGGDQLLEDKLKDTFGVSRTPLREAFRILEKEGLVEILPWKGAFVREITREDVEENYPVRANLEGLAARLAYEKFAQSDIEELERCFENMKQSIRKKDFAQYSKHHVAFHNVLVDASRNRTLIDIIRNLRICTIWHQNTYKFYQDDFGNPLKIHGQIVDMFKDKKASPEDVEKMFCRHIMAALSAFVATIEKNEK
jgi:DNA-binding GntR family transcriptional regulator